MVTSASVTIRWNTTPPPHAASAAATTPVPASRATVLAVRGKVVTLRLTDGTMRVYEADAAQANALRALVGRSIAFRVTH